MSIESVTGNNNISVELFKTILRYLNTVYPYLFMAEAEDEERQWASRCGSSLGASFYHFIPAG